MILCKIYEDTTWKEKKKKKRTSPAGWRGVWRGRGGRGGRGVGDFYSSAGSVSYTLTMQKRQQRQSDENHFCFRQKELGHPLIIVNHAINLSVAQMNTALGMRQSLLACYVSLTQFIPPFTQDHSYVKWREGGCRSVSCSHAAARARGHARRPLSAQHDVHERCTGCAGRGRGKGGVLMYVDIPAEGCLIYRNIIMFISIESATPCIFLLRCGNAGQRKQRVNRRGSPSVAAQPRSGSDDE